MKTFILRIIAVFSVLLAVQNASAWGANVGLSLDLFGTDTPSFYPMTSTISQTAANMAAEAECNADRAVLHSPPNSVAGNCTLLTPFVNQCTAYATGDNTLHNLVAATEAEARTQLCTQLGISSGDCPNRVSTACDTTTCPDDLIVGADVCECPAGMQLIPGETTMCENPPPTSDSDCDTLNAGDLFVDNRCQTPQSCVANEVRASDRISCDCDSGFTRNVATNVCEMPTTPTTCGVNEM